MLRCGGAASIRAEKMGNDAALRDLRHDVNAQCVNLKRAAATLRGEPTADELDMLKLMSETTRSLTDKIAAYETILRGSPPK